MSEKVFTPGSEVVTPRGRGTVVDVRATASGKFVIGVEVEDGEVRYFVEGALRGNPPAGTR
ncbi:hypothetical protein [Ornithinicoccus hortensis]|uniref:Uncharacterized protein n=1 Tax=Ornithinicoccus hortensis TaxID=82346 RepID=A0A542YTN4_9MICO|nr:hypothetical protein [Ornithinicoccus hortensis]TQL51411.1 hypothetical protein FB467_2557 [Ornithinicoccus hortensis]